MKNNRDVIIISNRSPYDFDRGEIKKGSGGLVKGMKAALGKNGLWIGLSRGNDDFYRADNNHQIPFGDIRMRKVFIPEKQYVHYYNDFANNFIWPLMHLDKIRLDIKSVTFPKPKYSHKGFDHYILVNRKFATAAMEELLERRANNIWIHDYHFMHLPKELRNCVKANKMKTKIGQFWHIPWFNPKLINGALKDNSAAKKSISFLVKNLLSNDILGFHTDEYVDNFIGTLKTLKIDAKAMKTNEGFIVRHKGYKTAVSVYPIGVNVKEIKNETRDGRLPINYKMGNTAIETLIKKRKAEGVKVLVGLERMDYTKGLYGRLGIVDLMLNKRKVAYLGFAQPTRIDIYAYKILKNKIIGRVNKINRARSKKMGYKPILLDVEKGIPSPWNYVLLKKADICMVTTLSDGMNMVVLESIMAKHALPKGKRGFVVLGHCGAGYILRNFGPADGLVHLSDPLDTKKSAKQILEAIDKRSSVSNELIRYVERHFNIENWSRTFSGDLNKFRRNIN